MKSRQKIAKNCDFLLFLCQHFEKGIEFMKYFCAIFSIILIVCSVLFLRDKTNKNENCLRIHIVANSSSAADQNIKYLVKDSVIEFLGNQLDNVDKVEDAQEKVLSLMETIKTIVDFVLLENGFSYQSKISILKEEFPLRAYGDKVFKEGKYQTIRIDLGEAKGDNWWCVVYPMVCYVPSENFANCEYISKIWEMINSVT